MILLCEGTHPREVLWIHRPPSPNETKKTNTENIPLSVSVPDDAVCLLWLSADMHLSTSGFACAGGIYCPFPELPGLHPGHPRAIPFQCIV